MEAKKFSLWDWVRVIYAVILLCFAAYVGYILTQSHDSNLIIGLMGLAFTVVALSFSIISTMSTERELKKLQK